MPALSAWSVYSVYDTSSASAVSHTKLVEVVSGVDFFFYLPTVFLVVCIL